MTTAKKGLPWWLWPVVVVLLPLIAAAAVVGLVVWLAAALILLSTVWVAWCARGQYALVVYSNSPVWQEYFERQILPAVGDRGVVLNWSERKQWGYSLAVALFWFFGGTREFNPLAIVFRPFAWAAQIPFLPSVQSTQTWPPTTGRRDAARLPAGAGRESG
jgi:hypothetical protein